ncbi:MAG: 30S ribosomal protein S12 methylthiotransferase RimO [candidate division Zixibacteria bacterium]|nr:30S ribosomal protein S12 methylthiotransferase RimO [candidate division Zixibacteria bacterium]
MKFYIKKLGCPKNDVDADYIAGMLIADGHTRVDCDVDADAVVVNTCGFILPAKEESIAEILYYEKLRKAGAIFRLYLTGCLSQRYGSEILKEIDGVDGIFGIGQLEQLRQTIQADSAIRLGNGLGQAVDSGYIAGSKRFVDTIYPYEYLKISDGCDRFCSYCAIPLIRGRYRSRPLDDIVTEARLLAEHGKKEVILVSQEGTAYGRDRGDVSVIDLLRALETIDGIAWIRLMYLHPESLTEKLIEYMTASEKVLGYFDMPLQHINKRILKKMNRRITRDRIERLITTIRDASPDNIIRTTFIAGFPGETDKEFDELEAFIADIEFDRLGVFAYSCEENTAAAGFNDQIPDKLAEERRDRLMMLQQQIAFLKNIALIGSTQHVIIDQSDDRNDAVGRTRGDCPEIDQSVIIRGRKLAVGDMLDVEITMAEGYDLIAGNKDL